MIGLDTIRRAAPAIAGRIVDEGGFLKVDDIKTLAELTPHVSVLVRCNNGRFAVPLQDVLRFTKIIEQHYQMMQASGQDPLMVSDYVRDISLLAE